MSLGWRVHLCQSSTLSPANAVPPQPTGWLAEHGWIKAPLSSGATMQWNQLDHTWWSSLSSLNGRHPHLGLFAVLWNTIIHCRVAQYLHPIQGWQEVLSVTTWSTPSFKPLPQTLWTTYNYIAKKPCPGIPEELRVRRVASHSFDTPHREDLW